MPHMTGIEFLTAAIREFPDVRRVLLTAYADTEAAIGAINVVKLDYYLLKPWDPPDQNLYPVLDDLLDQWSASYRPPFEGIRVVGTRWSPRCYEVREFLARHQIPYQWLDIEKRRRPEVQILRSIGERARSAPGRGPARRHDAFTTRAPRPRRPRRPAHAFADGVLRSGDRRRRTGRAGRRGLWRLRRTQDGDRGAGGSGRTGGAELRIENYLGFPSGLSGADLARRAVAQARRFGAEILAPAGGDQRSAPRVRTASSLWAMARELSCHAMMVATGVQWRKLNIPGIERLQGAGVYYGAGSTEALSCRDEDVYIIGGANSAGQAAMNFARYARKWSCWCAARTWAPPCRNT